MEKKTLVSAVTDLREIPLAQLAEPGEHLTDVVVRRVMAGPENRAKPVQAWTFQSSI